MNIGQQLSHYILESKLGDGGFGSVFRATDINTRCEVAIKCSHPNDSQQLPDQQQRFLREVECTSNLSHPNIVRVYEYGALPDGTLYLVIEYVKGWNLEKIMKNGGPFSFSWATNVILQVLDALREAHAHTIIHRDLKPANIMVQRPESGKDIVKLLDFGIAKALDGTQPDLTQQFFQNSVGFGTPQYMPPEQFFGKDLGPHSDIYSIALVYYELLAGKQAYPQKQMSDLIRAQIKEYPKIPEPYNQGPLYDVVFKKALAKDVKSRYSRAQDMIDDLRAILNSPEWFQKYEAATSSEPVLPRQIVAGPATVMHSPDESIRTSVNDALTEAFIDDGLRTDDMGVITDEKLDEVEAAKNTAAIPNNNPVVVTPDYLKNRSVSADISSINTVAVCPSAAGIDEKDLKLTGSVSLSLKKDDFNQRKTHYLKGRLLKEASAEQDKNGMSKRYNAFIDDMFEHHFGALVCCICLIVIIIGMLIVAIILKS